LIFLKHLFIAKQEENIMNSKVWKRKALSMCLIVATIATYSMVALAGAEKVTGELLVSGNGGGTGEVMVNGEAAKSGRTIFSSNSIVTPENSTAIVSLGKVGALELAPSSNLVLSFSSSGITGELTSGTVRVIRAENLVNIKLSGGEVLRLGAGESANSSKAQDDDASTGSGAWFIWALVLGGAAAGIILAATTNNNNVQLGGGTTVVSPSR
jgi:hypothetical protein